MNGFNPLANGFFFFSAYPAPRGFVRVRMKDFSVQLFDLSIEEGEKKNSDRGKYFLHLVKTLNTF